MEDDEDDPVEIKMDIVFEDFGPPAGEPRPRLPDVRGDFERLKGKQNLSGQEPWAPFSSVEDWDYARWIMESGLSQRQIDSMLKLDIVSKHFPSQGRERHGSHKFS